MEAISYNPMLLGIQSKCLSCLFVIGSPWERLLLDVTRGSQFYASVEGTIKCDNVVRI